MTDKLAFMDGEKSPAETTVPEVKAEKPEIQAQETPPQTAEPQSIEPAVPEKVVWTEAMALDEREKRQNMQRERDELRAKLAEATKQPASQPIDPLTDPEGFAAGVNDKIERARWETLTQTSLLIASQQHTADVVNKAVAEFMQAADQDPSLKAKAFRQPHPYDWVVNWSKQQGLLREIGDDPDAYIKRRATELGYVPTQRDEHGKFQAQPVTPQTPIPKPSLASAPAASSSTPKVTVGPGEAFGRMFADK